MLSWWRRNRFSASSRHGGLNKSTMNIPSECRIASIGRDHAMILPHDANLKPDGIFGKDNNFGFPYCHQGNIPDQEFGWGRSCDEFTKPVTLLGPHSAPLGMRFYTGNMFPSEYRNAIFVARHGSWNRSKKFGGDIVVVSLNENGTVKSVDPFITGFIENNNYLGRPADLLVLKDGSMLISDDYNGALYRVTYDSTTVGR